MIALASSASARLSPAQAVQRRAASDFVLQSKERVDALHAAGEYGAAIRLLDDELERQTTDFGKSWVLVKRADLRRLMRARDQAFRDLDRADELLRRKATGDRSDADVLASRGDKVASLLCTLLALRAQLFLEWGLLDLASKTVERVSQLLAALDGRAAAGDVLSAHYIAVNVLAAREDYPGLRRAVEEFRRAPVYKERPERDALLLARLGMALKEASRLDPAAVAQARAALDAALSERSLPSVERIQPELALAELALRDSDWPGAERWLASAQARMGPPERRRESAFHAGWTAVSARLAFERTDRKSERAELEAWRDELRCALAWMIDDADNEELRPGGYGFFQWSRQLALMSELVRLEIALAPGSEGVQRALDHVLAAGDVGTLSRRVGSVRGDLSRIRAELLVGGGDHPLLLYFAAAERSHLFVIDAREVQHFELACTDELELARHAAVTALHEPLPPQAPAWRVDERKRDLAKLASLLIPSGLRARLEACTRLTIVELNLLGDVPFEAFPRADGRSLGTTAAIAYVPSASVALRLARRARAERRESADGAPGSMLLVAAPASSGLAWTDADEERLLAAYPEHSRAALVGSDATLSRLDSALADARVLQLFTHGSYDASRERPATLLLDGESGAGRRFVGCDEVETLEAPALVVLTVCRSMAAPRRRGDAGACGLAGAFFSAGSHCRCVVQSAFDIDSEAAKRISARFHAELVRGIDPAEALRRAREELSLDEAFADPFHHALISVVGFGHAPLFTP